MNHHYTDDMTITATHTMTDAQLAEAVGYNLSLLDALDKSLCMWTARGDDAHELARATERMEAVGRRLTELHHETARREALNAH